MAFPVYVNKSIVIPENCLANFPACFFDIISWEEENLGDGTPWIPGFFLSQSDAIKSITCDHSHEKVTSICQTFL